jgi:Cof subfamily protein (haloacid dehalogenase superfamily)
MPHFSLLLADVDGTLVTEQKVLTARAQAAVLALRARGIRFSITSGRPPRGMAMLVEPLHLDSPIAGLNGAVFVQPDMSVIETRPLAADVARLAIEVIECHGMDAWLYTGTDWIIHTDDAAHVAREAWTVKFLPKIATKFAESDMDKAVKIVGVSDDHALVGLCEADMERTLGDRTSARRSQPYYLDITNPDANKGAVLDTMARFMRVPRPEIATIGDMSNDTLMFRRSGFSIAMGNASDEVKAQASAVTYSCNDEGFAKAVERYLLNGYTFGKDQTA